MPHTRIAFADANWLVAAFHISSESHWVNEWVSTNELLANKKWANQRFAHAAIISV